MLEMEPPLFEDRSDAGRKLATLLEGYRGTHGLVVALPRGGVVVAKEIARSLGLPLEVLVVRKIGHPENPEFGVGSLVEGAPIQLDHSTLRELGLSSQDLKATIAKEEREVNRRVRLYRGGAPFPDVRKRTVLLVDDGMATGNTAKAAVSAMRAMGAGRVVLAVAVASTSAAKELQARVDELVCFSISERFMAVGQFYRHFEQVEDVAVLEVLGRAGPTTSLAGVSHERA